MTLAAKILAIVLALFALSQQAAAGPIYTIDVFPALNPTIDGLPMTSATPGLTSVGSAVRTASLQVVEGNWSVQANQGSLQAHVAATANGVYGTANDFNVFTEFRYDDLIVNAPLGVSTVSGVLNLHLSGMMSFAVDPNNFDFAFGSVRVQVNFLSPLGGNIQAIGQATGVDNGGGLLSGSGGTAPIDVNLSIPFNATNFVGTGGITNGLVIQLSTSALGGDRAFGDGLSSSFSNFDLSFAIDRPAFELPDGVTVNSEQGGIVDN